MPEYEVRRFDGETAFPDAYEVRRDVFIKEQDVDEDIELDGRDDEATHFVVYDVADDRPVATARLRYEDDGSAKAERVAVLREYRGRGLGRLVMEHLEAQARENGCVRVRLNAQTAVEGFYERLGYGRVGEVFVEADIPHVEMMKRFPD
jgi:predicted GNAT family N-acyltransferase